MGLGIVGGRLYPSTEDGVKGAETAVRILNGEPLSNFPPKIVLPTSPQYDWRELRRWNIDQRHLPAGSTILFRSPTVWEQYRWWIVAGASICVLQALLIAGLVTSLIRRRRAEGSLVESEARFRTMADSAPVLIWMSGPDKLCTFLNKAWLAFTGRRLEQELGNGWADGVHRDDLERCVATYHGAFDRREPFIMQYRLRRHDGVFRTLTDEGVARYGPNGTFRGYIGACLDITDSIEREKVLREIEDRVGLAAEAAQLGVWELDTATGELWISDKARELFQFEPDEKVTYAEFQRRVHPEDRARRDAVTQRAIEARSEYEIEYRALLPNGTIRWMSGRGRCIADDGGKSCRLIGVSMDVTNRKQAEEESRHRREQIDLLSRVSWRTN
jgi:PAS domain S-box-containing protein